MSAQIPLLGALAVVLHDGHALLVQRSKPPTQGMWGFPGGHVEWGESALKAAQRELLEETGVQAQPLRYLTNCDLILNNTRGEVTTHYLLAAVACRYIAGKPLAADDALDARWVSFDDIRARNLPILDQVVELMELALAELD